jgi:hypothetical protein
VKREIETISFELGIGIIERGMGKHSDKDPYLRYYTFIVELIRIAERAIENLIYQSPKIPRISRM